MFISKYTLNIEEAINRLESFQASYLSVYIPEDLNIETLYKMIPPLDAMFYADCYSKNATRISEAVLKNANVKEFMIPYFALMGEKEESSFVLRTLLLKRAVRRLPDNIDIDDIVSLSKRLCRAVDKTCDTSMESIVELIDTVEFQPGDAFERLYKTVCDITDIYEVEWCFQFDDTDLKEFCKLLSEECSMEITPTNLIKKEYDIVSILYDKLQNPLFDKRSEEFLGVIDLLKGILEGVWYPEALHDTDIDFYIKASKDYIEYIRK